MTTQTNPPISAPAKIGSVSLPPIDQVGFVVRDLNKAMAQYQSLFGPFTTMDSPLQGALYRGTPTDCHLLLAFGKSGDIEMEFIQVLSGASPHSEFLDNGGEGIHHVRYRIDNLNAIMSAAEESGFTPIWYHDMGFAKWAYLEQVDNPGVILEFLQMPES